MHLWNNQHDIFVLTFSACAFSPDANCATCIDRPGRFCETCKDKYLRSRNKEICGIECEKCTGKNCETYTKGETVVCNSCWVNGKKENGTTSVSRGCDTYSRTCSDIYLNKEECRDNPDQTVCQLITVEYFHCDTWCSHIALYCDNISSSLHS